MEAITTVYTLWLSYFTDLQYERNEINNLLHMEEMHLTCHLLCQSVEQRSSDCIVFK